MLQFKKIILNLVLGKKASSEALSKHLQEIGVKIGNRVTFYGAHQISIDEQYPWLIEIGDDVQITAGVRILTHDYSWSVLKKVYGPILGCAGKVKIGSNVFIGSDSTILGGTEIGNNVIIGAGSLVKGKIPDDCVAIGNPCRPVMSLDTFYAKRLQRQREECINLGKSYINRTGLTPPQEVFHEFFFLFEGCKKSDKLNKCFDDKLKLVGNYAESKASLEEFAPVWNSYDEFIKELYLEIKNENATR